MEAILFKWLSDNHDFIGPFSKGELFGLAGLASIFLIPTIASITGCSETAVLTYEIGICATSNTMPLFDGEIIMVLTGHGVSDIPQQPHLTQQPGSDVFCGTSTLYWVSDDKIRTYTLLSDQELDRVWVSYTVPMSDPSVEYRGEGRTAWREIPNRNGAFPFAVGVDTQDIPVINLNGGTYTIGKPFFPEDVKDLPQGKSVVLPSPEFGGW